MTTDTPMQLGMVGLGRMGANLVRRLTRDGHRCVAYDVNADAVRALVAEGVEGAGVARGVRRGARAPAGGLADAARRGRPARPSTSSCALLDEGDVVIDGGNSYYRDDIERAARRSPRAGCTTSTAARAAGCWGLERGYCLMIGGEDDGRRAARSDLPVDRAGRGGVEPTPGRTRTDGTAPDGYLHCGPSGAGHFVKMVHNGIEYGMMAAIAEGLSIIEHADVGARGAPGATPRPRRCATPRRTPTTSTSPRSPSCGGAARSSGPGSSTSTADALARRRASTSSRAASRTPARDAGPCSRRSTSPCPRR